MSKDYKNNFHQFKKLKEISRDLRKKDTKAEQKLWEMVRNKKINNLKFYRQKIIGEFILDFYCHSLKLGIELDGKIHIDLKERDKERDMYLKNNFNIKIIRIENKFILENNSEDLKNYLLSILTKTL